MVIPVVHVYVVLAGELENYYNAIAVNSELASRAVLTFPWVSYHGTYSSTIWYHGTMAIVLFTAHVYQVLEYHNHWYRISFVPIWYLCHVMVPYMVHVYQWYLGTNGYCFWDNVIVLQYTCTNWYYYGHREDRGTYVPYMVRTTRVRTIWDIVHV